MVEPAVRKEALDLLCLTTSSFTDAVELERLLNIKYGSDAITYKDESIRITEGMMINPGLKAIPFEQLIHMSDEDMATREICIIREYEANKIRCTELILQQKIII